jgi:hypothetical protein
MGLCLSQFQAILPRQAIFLGRSARRRVAVAFMDKNDLHVESIFDVLSQIMFAMIR